MLCHPDWSQYLILPFYDVHRAEIYRHSPMPGQWTDCLKENFSKVQHLPYSISNAQHTLMTNGNDHDQNVEQADLRISSRQVFSRAGVSLVTGVHLLSTHVITNTGRTLKVANVLLVSLHNVKASGMTKCLPQHRPYCPA